MYIDTHCHIDDEKFTDKDLIINNYIESGVDFVINSGSDIKSSVLSKALAEKYESVYYSVGVHPDSAEEIVSGGLEKLKALAESQKCLAIGEIGLDYHYEPFDKTVQQKAFVSQIDLANELDLPIIVHSRDAHYDTLSIIEKNSVKRKGTMHCFSGSVELMQKYVELGFYISFGGTLTFKNSVKAVEVLKSVPIDRILTETDSPYLAPEGKRGQINEPKNVVNVYEFISKEKGISVEEISAIIKENAKRLFYKLK